MSIKSGQAVTVLFSTANATTGAAADATGTPAGTLYVNGTANGATVTVTNITTGVYKAAVTLPTLSAGDIVSLRIAATVGGVAGEGVVWQDTADTKRVSDLADLDAAGVRTAVGLAAANLDTQLGDLPTNAELEAAIAAGDDPVLAAIAALNNLSSAGAQAAAAAALAAYDAATGSDIAGLNNFDPETDAVIVGSIQTDAITAAAIATAAAQEIADVILTRSYSFVEDTAGDHTLAALIAGALESAIVGTTWTIYKTDGVTAMLTKTVTVDNAAEPVTGVA